MGRRGLFVAGNQSDKSVLRLRKLPSFTDFQTGEFVMIRIFLTSAAMLIAAPAIAQTATSADPAGSASTTASPDAASPTPSTSGATSAKPAEATQATPGDIAKIVDSEFPTYDADKSGNLSKTEFAAWLTALKQQEVKATGKAMSQTDLAAWADGAFATADKDKNAMVTKQEITTYLGG
jgi:hypothetical protein